MPNWVTNKIKVTASKELLDEFEKKYCRLDDEDNYFFDFDRVIPEPKTKDECPKDYLNYEGSHIQEDEKRPWFNWYSWHNKYWGTKWNSCSNEIERTSKFRLELVFDTAWSIPKPVLKELVKQNPNIKFEFFYSEEWETKFHKLDIEG